MTRRAPGSRMLGMRPRRIASRKLRSQSGTCRDSSAKLMKLVGKVLWFGGSAVAAPVFSAAPACSILFMPLRRRLRHKRAVMGKTNRIWGKSEKRPSQIRLTERRWQEQEVAVERNGGREAVGRAFSRRLTGRCPRPVPTGRFDLNQESSQPA